MNTKSSELIWRHSPHSQLPIRLDVSDHRFDLPSERASSNAGMSLGLPLTAAMPLFTMLKEFNLGVVSSMPCSVEGRSRHFPTGERRVPIWLAF